VNLKLKLKILERFRYQADFAMAAKLREERLSRIITGRVRPSPEEMQRIASLLNAQVEELFPQDADHAASA